MAESNVTTRGAHHSELQTAAMKLRGVLDATRLALLHDDSPNSDTFEGALRAATDIVDEIYERVCVMQKDLRGGAGK